MFDGIFVPCKYDNILQIRAKFNLAFIHALILLLDVQQYLKRNGCIPCSFLQNLKTQVVWAIHVPLEELTGYTPVSFRFHSFYELLEDYGVNGIWLMVWKPLHHKRLFTR